MACLNDSVGCWALKPATQGYTRVASAHLIQSLFGRGTSSRGAKCGGKFSPRPLEALLIYPRVQAAHTSEP